MLLYRPLLSAYRSVARPEARRFILRELSDPTLHAEPAELVDALAAAPDPSPLDEPLRLAAEVSLRASALKLRLTTRDAGRLSGGLWTALAGAKDIAQLAAAAPSADCSRSAGALLGDAARAIVAGASGLDRARALCALGDLGADVALPVLKDELGRETMPAAAAIGLARLGEDVVDALVLPAMQANGLARTAPWLGVLLAAQPPDRALPVALRLAKSAEPALREQGAIALGGLGAGALPALDLFAAERDPHVKLHAMWSLGRLGVPGGRDTLRRFFSASDAPLVRIAAIQAAGRSTAAQTQPFLEWALAKGSPEERAEALQSLVCLGVSGPAFVAAAQKAVASRHARLTLVGLLGLCVWSPPAAFDEIRRIFAAPASAEWFLATHALRYLRSDQTVPLLVRLFSAVKGTELEEVAADALCRHLDEAAARDALLARAAEGPPPGVLARTMVNLARHLADEHAASVTELVRKLLKPRLPAAVAGPLLGALGAFGDESDVPRLTAHLDGDAGADAVNALVLLMRAESAAALEKPLAGGPGPASARALVALWQLGRKDAAQRLAALANAIGGLPLAAQALSEMAASAALAPRVPRLLLLRELLAREGAPARPAPPPPSPPPPAAPPAPEIQEVLSRPRKVSLPAREAPRLSKPPPAGTGERVYRNLGKRLESVDGEGRSQALMLAGAVAVVVCVLLVALVRGGPASAGGSSEELRKLAGIPALYRDGRDPEEGAVSDGSVLESSGDPVVVRTRLRENMLTIVGRFRYGALRFVPGPPAEAELTGALLGGRTTVEFPRGKARVEVEGARTTVEIVRGKADLELRESTFVLAVKDGQARILRGSILMKTLFAGQSGEFLDGNPIGHFEDAAAGK